jgi:hypothetical protein
MRSQARTSSSRSRTGWRETEGKRGSSKTLAKTRVGAPEGEITTSIKLFNYSLFIVVFA